MEAVHQRAGLPAGFRFHDIRHTFASWLALDGTDRKTLQDLGGFSHLWVLSWFHLARGYRSQVMPPRDTRKRGVFATRAPQRPNPIGLSCVRLVCIDKRRLHIADHDLLDGTPVLDLKPYLPYADSVPGAAIGYVAELPVDGADHRAWWQDKGREPPRVYRGLDLQPGRASAGHWPISEDAWLLGEPLTPALT